VISCGLTTEPSGKTTSDRRYLLFWCSSPLLILRKSRVVPCRYNGGHPGPLRIPSSLTCIRKSRCVISTSEHSAFVPSQSMLPYHGSQSSVTPARQTTALFSFCSFSRFHDEVHTQNDQCSSEATPSPHRRRFPPLRGPPTAEKGIEYLE